MPSSGTLQRRPTSSGRLLGSTTPRLWTPPLATGSRRGPCGCGCYLTPRTTHGFRAVEFAGDVLGIQLHPWQRWLLIHVLELAPWGGFRFRTVIILVARQNGKTTLIEVKNLFKLFVLGVPLVLGTAQDLDTAEESWDNAVATVEGIPELYDELALPKDGRGIVRVNGKKTLRLKSGARWRVAAASRRGGRGKSGDDVNLDELREHHGWDSWSAISKTTMAREKAQIFGFSNAGDVRSVVLNSLQDTGRAAAADPVNADPSVGLFEWSAPDELRCTCSRIAGQQHEPGCALWERRWWAQSNPSLGYPGGVTELAIRNAMLTDPEATLLTEVFCVRVKTLAPQWEVIKKPEWDGLADGTSAMADPVVFALETNYEGTASAIAAAGDRPDGQLQHVESVDHDAGMTWLVERAVALRDKWRPLAFVLDKKGRAGALIPQLEQRGFQAVSAGEQADPGKTPLVIPSVVEVGNAYEQFVNGATETRSFRHRDQKAFADALAGATTRLLGDTGATTWSSKNSSVDIAPIRAASFALWGLSVRRDRRRPPPAPPARGGAPASTARGPGQAGLTSTADLADVGF